MCMCYGSKRLHEGTHAPKKKRTLIWQAQVTEKRANETNKLAKCFSIHRKADKTTMFSYRADLRARAKSTSLEIPWKSKAHAQRTWISFARKSIRGTRLSYVILSALQ